MSYNEEEDDNCEDDGSDYYGHDDDYDYAFPDDNDNYDKMQSQFDNVDLPPGVEISLPWMDSATSKTAQPASSSSLSSVTLHSGSTTSSDQVHNPKEVAASSSTISEDENLKEAARERYEGFKRFDIVEEFTDHHYSDAGLANVQVTVLMFIF